MQFGVWVPTCRHLAISEVIRRSVIRAEQLGYDSVWASDHVIVPNRAVERIGAAMYDPLITLAVAAGSTRAVLLGTTVLIVPYRNPVVTAKMVSTLDALSGGRVVLGIGAGWLEEESSALNAPFDERGPMTDEYLAAMRELWTSDEPKFDGKYTRFGDLRFEPKPLQKPHPPIWVGGHAPASLRRTAEIGAAWHPINRSVAELKSGVAQIERMCAERGRKVPPTISLRNDVRVLNAGETPPPPIHGGSVLAGEPAALADRIAELGAVGVQHLVLEFLSPDPDDFDRQMGWFAQAVRPRLADSTRQPDQG
jgi:probable F420-dependent oxidoreductase